MLPLDHIEAPVILAILHDLTNKDDILVIGAYKGDTCSFIRYYHPHVRLTAFEPQDWAYEELFTRGRQEGFGTWNVALAVEDKDDVPLYEYGTDAASLLELPGARSLGKCRTVDAVRFLRSHNLTTAALALVNIEGYEYGLIPYLLSNAGLDDAPSINDIKITRFLVQCHYKETYLTAYGKMQEALNLRGYTMLDVGSGWELWQRLR